MLNLSGIKTLHAVGINARTIFSIIIIIEHRKNRRTTVPCRNASSVLRSAVIDLAFADRRWTY